MLSEAVEDIESFYLAAGIEIPAYPTVDDKQLILNQIGLIKEELNEYRKAVQEGNLLASADGMINLLYTVLEAVLIQGFKKDVDELFEEVQKSNMTKD
mgnify:FL=1